MTELHDRLVEKIRRDGPLPFAAYMSLALYDRSWGYYAQRVRTGRHGDFMTSPELDPAFGWLWARAIRQVWAACGMPERFDVVEVGPGEGAFAAALLEALDIDGLRYTLVERMAPARARQQERLARDGRVAWTDSLDRVDAICGCVVANEVLDNLPVHVVERSGDEVVAVYVGLDGDRLVEELHPPANPEVVAFLDRHGMDLLDGTRAEVALASEGFVGHAAAAVERGSVFFIDYGDTGPGLAQRPEGTLVCYSSGGADTAPLDRPGEKDITAHANWSAVQAALTRAGCDVIGPRDQGDVLLALGLRDLDVALEDEHARAISEKRGADAVRALSRRHAVRALADRSGLGGLQVVAGIKGVPRPDFLSI